MKKVNAYDVYGKPHEVDTDKLKFSVHFYGLAVDGDKILISPQWDGFDFPGGTAKKGETHIETLKREFREETGYEVEPEELLGIWTSFFHHIKRDEDYQSYLIYYTVKIVGGELSDSGFDADEKEYAKIAQWVKIDELKNMHHACSVNLHDELMKKIRLRL